MESYTQYFQLISEKTTEIVEVFAPIPNMSHSSGIPKTIEVLDYTDYRITRKEFDKILKFIYEHDLILYPIRGPFGFHPAYQIYEIDPLVPSNEFGKTLLCQFDEKQLPDKVSFDTISHIMYSKENLSRIKKCGLEKPRKKDFYFY